MLELRPHCERCHKDLPYDSTEAYICTFECTFCSDCVEGPLNHICPNCGGDFQKRPIRPAKYIEKYPMALPLDAPKFQHISPVMASADVARDVRWYNEKLQFINVFDSRQYQDTLDYAVLKRETLLIHLQFQFPQDMTSTDVRFQIKNLDPLIKEFLTSEVISEKNITRHTAWGTNEMSFFDPSDNRLTFFEDI